MGEKFYIFKNGVLSSIVLFEVLLYFI